jgi:hypothetical protein
MARVAVFEGLVIDENEHPVSVVEIGGEAMYVVDDAGFRRHISSETVDRQVLDFMREAMEGHEDVISEQTAKMMGQDDPFSRAMILNQIKQMDQQFDTLMNTGIPEESRAYLGMMGFHVVINVHGDVIRVDQPGMIPGGEDEGE